MFIQRCFIRKNNEYLRYCLKELGYIENKQSIINNNGNEMLIIEIGNNPYFCIMDVSKSESLDIIYDIIDCETNDDLFLAIAALRDDNDNYQLFKHNTEDIFYECNHDEFHMFSIDPDNCQMCDHKDDYHKATVEELINHFK